MKTFITHAGTLKAMAKRKLIKYPIDEGHCYVDEINNLTSFEYKGHQYCLKYINGCFYPFVAQIQSSYSTSSLNVE